MDEVLGKAKQLLGPAVSGQLSQGDEGLIPASRYAGADGRPDPWLLAAELAGLLALRAQGAGGQLTGLTSEGTSISLSQPDLAGMAARLRAMSPSAGGAGGAHVLQTDLGLGPRLGTGRAAGYLVWDGDLPEVLEWSDIPDGMAP